VKAAFKHLLAVTVILVVSLPVTFIVTILLSPLWSWIEATYKVESIGHSGPSDWCFYLMEGLLLVPALFGYWIVVKPKT